MVRGRPHLRVENRCLPAGPTVVDVLANAAFYYGLVKVLAEADRPVWSQMSFSAAEENFHDGAGTASTRGSTGRASARCRPPSWCCGACCRWPTEGLEEWGVDDRRHATGCSASSSSAACTGATARPGRPATFHRLFDEHDRPDALREMMREYVDHMHSNEPVHTWPAG